MKMKEEDNKERIKGSIRNLESKKRKKGLKEKKIQKQKKKVNNDVEKDIKEKDDSTESK